MSRQIKVLVVDDSALMRKYLREIIEREEDMTVIGAARDGWEAVELNLELQPDVITMDVNMPHLDGLTALQYIMLQRPCPVLVVSSITQKGALTTFEALELGAFDYVPKPDGTVSLQIKDVAREITEKIRAAHRAGKAGGKKRSARGNRARPGSDKVVLQERPSEPPPLGSSGRKGGQLVLIGVSTGGPKTLMEILPFLPADFPAPVFVIQHMPESFTSPFAQRLDQNCRLTVVESVEGMALLPGMAVVARGGVHVKLDRRPGEDFLRIRHSLRPLEALYRPSVEVAFRSAMQVVGAENLIAVILTGMGNDGAAALKDIKEAGGVTVAESEETAVVWGMPGEAVRLGAAGTVLPSYKIAEFLVRTVGAV